MNSRSSIFHNYEYTLNSLYSSVLNRVLQLKALGKIAKNRGRYFYIPSLIVSNAFQLFAPDMSMPSYKLIIVFTFDAFQGRSNVLWNRGGGGRRLSRHIFWPIIYSEIYTLIEKWEAMPPPFLWGPRHSFFMICAFKWTDDCNLSISYYNSD